MKGRRVLGLALAVWVAVVSQSALGREVIRPLNGAGVRLPEGVDRVRIPAIRVGAGLAVRVAVNGEDLGWFMVDTGWSFTCLDTKVAERLKLKQVGQTQMQLLGGARTAQILEADELKVGGVTAGARHVGSVDLGMLRDVGVDLAGMLGSDVLREAPFTLDFRDASLTFYPPGKVPADAKAGEQRVVELAEDTLVVRASVDGRAGRFAIDTGMLDNVGVLAESFAWSDAERAARRHVVRDSEQQLGGRLETKRARFAKLELYGRAWGRPWLEIEERHRSAGKGGVVPRGCVGTLGAKLFDGARLTVDAEAETGWVTWADETVEAYVGRLRAEAKGGMGVTVPLVRAIEARRADAVRRLLDEGEAVAWDRRHGGDPLAEAARWPEALGWLLAKKPGVEEMVQALGTAAEEGEIESVKLLLAAGAKVGAPVGTGETPLFRAAAANRAEVVEALLAAGADVNAVRRDGTTPVAAAAFCGAPEAVRVLLKHKPDVNRANESGHRPLILAAFNGDEETVRGLIAAGADVSAWAGDGGTALIAAASQGYREVVRLLMAAKADPTPKLGDGRTAEAVALDNGYLDVAQVLRGMGPPAVRLPARARSATVPLAWFRGTPCARVAIDGQDVGWFGVSSEVKGFVLDVKAARRLNAATVAAPARLRDKASPEAALCELKDVRVAGVPIGPRLALVADLDKMPFVNGEVAGMIDRSMLLDLACSLDYREPSLTFYAGEAPADVTGRAKAFPVDFHRGRALSTLVSVEGETGWFTVGLSVQSHLLDLSTAFALERRPILRGKHALRDVTLEGGKVVDRTRVRLDGVEVAGHRVSPADVNLPKAPAEPIPWGQTLAGTVNGLSRTARLTLEPRGGRAWCEWREAEGLEGYLKRIEALGAAGSGPAPERPLPRAARDGREEAVERLLAGGADANGRNVAGYPALMAGVRSPGVVRRLLAAGADPNAAAAFMKDTPLTFAAENGNVEVVRALLAAGAKVDQANALGRTALHRAAEGNWPEVLEVLVAAGADVNRQTGDGATALMIAAADGERETVALLLRHKAAVRGAAKGGVSPLMLAASAGQVEVMRALMAAGADPNEAAADGLTPLIAAAARNQVYAVRLLLQAGADPRAKGQGKTAYEHALAKSQVHAMRVLRYEVAGR